MMSDYLLGTELTESEFGELLQQLQDDIKKHQAKMDREREHRDRMLQGNLYLKLQTRI